MAQIYGYIRTSRRLQEGVAGMDPASQERQLRQAGVPLANVYRDVGVSGATGTRERHGWHQLDRRLAGGDTLVVVAIDRIGRHWPDTVRAITELRERRVKIRSLAEAEAQWTRYLEADEGTAEAFIGQILVLFAAWVAAQERESIRRRTIAGLDRARSQGKVLGGVRKVTPAQVELMRRLRAEGESYRRIAAELGVAASTVARALKEDE